MGAFPSPRRAGARGEARAVLAARADREHRRGRRARRPPARGISGRALVAAPAGEGSRRVCAAGAEALVSPLPGWVTSEAMGVGVGLVLIAAGAILIWAVHATVTGIDVNALGVILLVLGIVILFLDLLWWHSW